MLYKTKTVLELDFEFILNQCSLIFTSLKRYKFTSVSINIFIYFKNLGLLSIVKSRVSQTFLQMALFKEIIKAMIPSTRLLKNPHNFFLFFICNLRISCVSFKKSWPHAPFPSLKGSTWPTFRNPGLRALKIFFLVRGSPVSILTRF